uniref:Uncharacterized protein n=1 Tax=Monodelphis domestica TaxID=13616 RepID=F7AQ76_MONDO
MPKRRVTFQDVGVEEDGEDLPKKKLVDPVTGAGGPGSRFKGKHSLDSDEEDDDEDGSSKYVILASEDVEGEAMGPLMRWMKWSFLELAVQKDPCAPKSCVLTLLLASVYP